MQSMKWRSAKVQLPASGSFILVTMKDNALPSRRRVVTE